MYQVCVMLVGSTVFINIYFALIKDQPIVSLLYFASPLRILVEVELTVVLPIEIHVYQFCICNNI